jgi:hypothetical protein
MGAVSDAFADLNDSVTDTVAEVQDFVEDTGQAVIDEVVTPVVTAVQKTYDAFEEDPVGTSLKLAAAASGNPLYVVAANTAVEVANGANLDEALEKGAKAGVRTYVAQQIGQAIGEEVNAGVDSAAAASTYGTDVGSQQSNMLAAQESGMGTAGDVAGNVAGKIAGGTAAGVVMGQDPLTALTNSGISAGTSAVTSQIPGFDQLSPTAQRAVNSVVSAALMGGDPSQALVNAAINAGIGEAKAQYKASQMSGVGGTRGPDNIDVGGGFNPAAGSIGSTNELAEQVIPQGVQVAGPMDAESLKVNVSGAPIYAESSAAKTYKPPFGYRLMSSAEADNKPAGAFYDPTTNAWLAPDNETVAGLQQELMKEPEDYGKLVEEPSESRNLMPTKPNEVPIVDTEFTPDLKTSQEDFLASIGINPSSVSGAPAQQTDPLAGIAEAPKPIQTTSSDQAYWDAIGIDPNSVSNMPAQETDPLADIIPVTQQPTLAELSKSLTSTPTSTPVTSVKAPASTSSGFNLGNAALIGGAALGLGALAQDNSTPAAQAAYRQQILNWNARQVQPPIDGAAQGQAMLDPRFVSAAHGGLMSLAGGGALGDYSDGGRLLKGPGDGMSDNIPASISNKQPARLADGEFVIPADVVSHLGNGSTEAGANVLYKMMDQVRRARTGNPKQGKQIKPQKFIPK